MRKVSLAIFLSLSLGFLAQAQEEGKNIAFFPEVHFRSFWMNTAYPNQELKEDYALGMSLNLGTRMVYRTNWSFKFGYRFFGNAASSAIWEKDPITGQPNRYEAGLFDLLNPQDRFFGKLETFSLSYETKNFGIHTGRMGIQSDWVNAQDGRLSPTAIEGVHVWAKPTPKWKFSIWGIGRMSIRGSSRWYGVGGTIGIYPQGRTVTGKPGNYFGHTSSDWLSILEVDRQIGKISKIRFSNTYVQNVLSTYWIAYEFKEKTTQSNLFGGIQFGMQHGVGNGGNEDPDLRYKDPKDVNFSWSGRLGWSSGRWLTHLNFTQVVGSGRWLSPREWGKDAWYTFIPRERNEGYSSVQALVGYVEYQFEKTPAQLYLHGGIHRISDLDDPSANKYNFPSYSQLNAGLKYQPKAVKGLDIHLILMAKKPLTKSELSPIQAYNKVEILHFNGIINWKWNR